MKLTPTACALLFAALWATASDADYQDALASEAAYCARLSDGAHTDYLNIGEVCNDRH